MFLTKSIVYTALLAVVRADNTAAIAAGEGLLCDVPEGGDVWDSNREFLDLNKEYTTPDMCYEEAKQYARDYTDYETPRTHCFMHIGAPGFFCMFYSATPTDADDIRRELTAEEKAENAENDDLIYHAWFWNTDVEVAYPWPEEEPEPEDQEEADEEAEEEAAHMLAPAAVATVAAYMISQIWETEPGLSEETITYLP